MKPCLKPRASALFAILLVPLALAAADNRITEDLVGVEVMHNGERLVIGRGHDPEATLPELFQKTDRGCPPFCVQPMTIVPGVETIGELELLDYLQRLSGGDTRILVIDSRTPDWVMRGTIPGAVNIPWNRLNPGGSGTFAAPPESDTFKRILTEDFAAQKNETTGVWSFDQAKTLVLFCNGVWCPQSSINIKTLHAIGYPVEKIKWYRGGMQDWFSLGLTTVRPD